MGNSCKHPKQRCTQHRISCQQSWTQGLRGPFGEDERNPECRYIDHPSIYERKNCMACNPTPLKGWLLRLLRTSHHHTTRLLPWRRTLSKIETPSDSMWQRAICRNVLTEFFFEIDSRGDLYSSGICESGVFPIVGKPPYLNKWYFKGSASIHSALDDKW